MLDCGEGSWQQLVRMVMHTPKMMNRKESCSSTEVEEWAATALKLVWISHPHADHHLGLVRVISERQRFLRAAVGGNPEPLLVIAPLSVLLFLEEFAVLDPLVKDAYTPLLNSYFEPAGSATESRGCTVASEVACENTCGGPSENLRNVKPKRVYRNFQTEANTEKAADILRKLSITAFRNVKVVHCSQAYAVSLEFSSGCKIVYSGDTRPCQQVVDLGRDATILIHEATFDDTKGDEAVKKKHSTISEAISVGKEMNAYRVILTHFSQRYPSAPPLPSDCQTTTSSVILAFDFLRLSFADCLWAPLMNRVLSIAFPPESDELDDINNEAGTEGQLIDSNRIPTSGGGKKGKNRPLPSGSESVSKVPKYK